MSLDADPQWDFYFCRVDDGPASIALDLRWMGSTPAESHPLLLCVRFVMNDPRPDGLSSPAEMPALSAAEDQLSAVLARACGAVPVGRFTGHGLRELFYYAEREEGLHAAVTEVVQSTGYEAMLRAEEDPEWQEYYGFLAPDARAYQWILDRRVLDKLQHHGDDPRLSRPVDHYLSLPDEAALAEFEAGIEGQGFTVTAELRDGHMHVHLVREDPVRLDHLSSIVWSLRERAERLLGEYDGWGCPIARPE